MIMKATSIVMLVTSLWFVIFGILVLTKNKVGEKIRIAAANARDKEGYIKFNGRFNIIVGSLGVLIGIADIFAKENSKVTLIAFVVVMMGSSFVQSMLSNKYR